MLNAALRTGGCFNPWRKSLAVHQTLHNVGRCGMQTSALRSPPACHLLSASAVCTPCLQTAPQCGWSWPAPHGSYRMPPSRPAACGGSTCAEPTMRRAVRTARLAQAQSLVCILAAYTAVQPRAQSLAPVIIFQWSSQTTRPPDFRLSDATPSFPDGSPGNDSIRSPEAFSMRRYQRLFRSWCRIIFSDVSARVVAGPSRTRRFHADLPPHGPGGHGPDPWQLSGASARGAREPWPEYASQRCSVCSESSRVAASTELGTPVSTTWQPLSPHPGGVLYRPT